MILFALLGSYQRHKLILKYTGSLPEENVHFPKSGYAKFLTTTDIRTGPTVFSYSIGKYNTGDIIKYDSYVNGDGRTWISYMSGSGLRHYCCAIDGDGTVLISVNVPSDYASSASKTTVLPIPLFLQKDWNTPFGNGTIADSGSGPTCFAMVASYLLGKTITPNDAISWCGDSYYLKNFGLQWSYFEAAANHFGCGPIIKTTVHSEAYQAIKNKKPVISNQGPGIFTKGGHFIVLRGSFGTNGVYVNDPSDNFHKNFKDHVFNFNTEIAPTSYSYWIFSQKQTKNI